ncbi:MAG TPA: sialate O-acetylesterase [Kiritimatiellia bacterium]|nr:sialate O-acetylesterase [Kiritimatiellia bacterium]
MLQQKVRRALAMFGAIALLSAEVAAETRVSGLFSDHMVVQRDQRIPLWGRSAPGAGLELDFAGQSRRVRADESGRWRTDFDAIPAGGPHTITIKGPDRKIVIRDVLAGEVWIASGQSNMEWPLNKTTDRETLQGGDALIRLFRVAPEFSSEPAEELAAKWQPFTPASAATFSAVALHFGAALRRELGVPVGLIQSAKGGTRAELWMSPDAMRASGAHERPWRNKERSPGDLFNGMIHPLIPFGIRGAIWYQGESNSHTAEFYQGLLSALITDWRAKWAQGDFPFGVVQLPNFSPPKRETSDSWAIVREAQRQVAETLPHVGLAVTIDVGDPDNIHPGIKQPVGDRLARWALARVYGESLPHTGPRVTAVRTRDAIVELAFDSTGGAPVLHGEEPYGFELAGADGVFHPADARLVGATLRLRSRDVGNPEQVRYAWTDNPRASLFDAEGLPATPFSLRLETGSP